MSQSSEKQLKILIGLPVLDNIEMTSACLDSLETATETTRLNLAVDVLVIDNGSTDDIKGLTENFSRKSRFNIFYHRNDVNLGVAPAWNQILYYRKSPDSESRFPYDYYVVSNNDVIYGPDWLQPMVDVLEKNSTYGWVSSLENGSPVLSELLESHKITAENYINPKSDYTAEAIRKSVETVYSAWGSHAEFVEMIRKKDLPEVIKNGRSAVCFMVKPEMIDAIGGFDEDYCPVGIAEDLEYFLRMDRILLPDSLTEEVYPEDSKWQYGFCGQSVIHHNWCMTRQGKHFDGRKWDKEKEKNWKRKFRKSRKYFTKLLPPIEIS